MATKRAVILLAIGGGLLAGALFEFTLGVKRDTPVCDDEGLNCGMHYSAPSFAILMVSMVVGVIGATMVYYGLRDISREKRDA